MQPLIDIQSHTLFHPVLTTCSDAECRDEIVTSKKDVECLTGKSCEHFAYPNGDYEERELDYVREAGYASARTLDAGWNDGKTDPYRLKAVIVSDDASVNLLAAQMTNLPAYFRYLKQGSLKGKYPVIDLKKEKE